jgi:hypothetical protein
MSHADLIKLLDDLRNYMDNCEDQFEYDHGGTRTITQLIADHRMPCVYWELLDAIKALQEIERRGDEQYR